MLTRHAAQLKKTTMAMVMAVLAMIMLTPTALAGPSFVGGEKPGLQILLHVLLTGDMCKDKYGGYVTQPTLGVPAECVYNPAPTTPGRPTPTTQAPPSSTPPTAQECANQTRLQKAWDDKYSTFTSGDLKELNIPARPNVDSRCLNPSLVQNPPTGGGLTPGQCATLINSRFQGKMPDDPAAAGVPKECYTNVGQTPPKVGDLLGGLRPPANTVSPPGSPVMNHGCVNFDCKGGVNAPVITDKTPIKSPNKSATRSVGGSSGGGGSGGGGGGSVGSGNQPNVHFNFAPTPSKDGPEKLDCSIEGRRAKSTILSSQTQSTDGSGVSRGIVTKDLSLDEKCAKEAGKTSIQAPDANDPNKSDTRVRY